MVALHHHHRGWFIRNEQNDSQTAFPVASGGRIPVGIRPLFHRYIEVLIKHNH
jgi:hypothetical protein